MERDGLCFSFVDPKMHWDSNPDCLLLETFTHFTILYVATSFLTLIEITDLLKIQLTLIISNTDIS